MLAFAKFYSIPVEEFHMDPLGGYHPTIDHLERWEEYNSKSNVKFYGKMVGVKSITFGFMIEYEGGSKVFHAKSDPCYSRIKEAFEKLETEKA